jgi:hypothetical protein
MNERRKSIMGLLLLVFIFIGLILILNVLHRPCRHCYHPPHVERTCGVEVRAIGLTGACSCQEDR